jgi:catechol 2,3-dioxygenase-like lactoylglutathione lyase family enzyme
VDLKLEVVVVPVSDVDRAKGFYETLGFRMDIDYVGGPDFRVVQFTPPGSECSIIIGTGITSAVPGSIQGLQLVVADIEAARVELIARGAKVGDIFHDLGGIFYHLAPEQRAAGPDPERHDYGSFASFSDPDGNLWMLQEVRKRAPGR